MSRYDYQAIWDSLIKRLKHKIYYQSFLKKLEAVRVSKGGEFVMSRSYQWVLKKFPTILSLYRKEIRVLSFDNLDLNQPPRMV